MKSESRIELRQIIITDINLDVSIPYKSDEDLSFAIDLESTWSLSEDNKMYISFPAYAFEATGQKADGKNITINIKYFCVADRGPETLVEIDEEILTELRQSVETIVLHHFVRDLNDLLARTGYPPIHFSSISMVLEDEV